MLCTKYGFVQSMDCPAQSIDRYFAQQSMDLSRGQQPIKIAYKIYKSQDF